jgi:hypothetical protein
MLPMITFSMEIVHYLRFYSGKFFSQYQSKLHMVESRFEYPHYVATLYYNLVILHENFNSEFHQGTCSVAIVIKELCAGLCRCEFVDRMYTVDVLTQCMYGPSVSLDSLCIPTQSMYGHSLCMDAVYIWTHCRPIY